MDDPEPSPSGRSKRQRNDKNGRLSALEKLRQLKGSKHKYEVTELDNVYDEVDEKAYSKTVMERQNDDWIVDDGGSGYVEDGREIFDDDLDDDSIQEAARKNSLAGPRKRKKVETKGKGNIKSMLMSMPAKKKTEDNLNDDDILGDLMSELQKDQPTPKRKDTGVRNKFATSKVQTPTRQESSASKPLDVDDFLEPMFESKSDKTTPSSAREKKAPRDERGDKKPPLVGEKKTNGRKPERDHFTFSEQSTSQRIDNDDTQSQMDREDRVDIDTPVTQEGPVDSNQYEEDLGNFDFAEMEVDANELPQCSTKSAAEAEKVDTKTVKKPESQVPNFRDEKSKNEEVEMMDQAWADAFSEQLAESELATASNVEIDSVPLVTNKAGDKVFRFYWWDAHEDYFKQPGVVYMFGKAYNEATGSYVSCCLQVKNIPRRIYLLPREFVQDSSKLAAEGDGPRETSISDVYEEFNKWATKNRVTEFRSAKVTKRYAFDRAGTPKECEYLEVRYSAAYPPMDPSYSGPTIEHVFGTSVNALELLLIERKIRGPCWLEVKAALPCGNPISWCKLQVNCAKFDNIAVCESVATEKLPIPPLVMATLNVRMSLNAKQHQNEVVMIGLLLHNEYQIDKPPPKPLFQQHYCLVTHPRDVPWPRHARELLTKTLNTRVVRCETEFELLEQFLDIVHKCDPDLLIGYDCGFQLDVLMHRISTLKLKNWSRVSKLRRTVMPMFKGKINLGQCFSGRPICDIQVSAKELNLKVRSYDLQSLCCAVLKKTENDCKEIKPADCLKFYAEAAKIEKLLQITMNEALYIVTLLFELNVMPLAVQITQIAGNVLSRTLSAGRAERNEYLLLHAFFKKDYITPDKRYASKSKDENAGQSRRKKPAYSGGLVLDPKKGFYDKLILLMDFNSLYPSIIQEYNMCFTTIAGAAYADLDDLVVPESNLEPGVVPTEIRKLVESRGEVKKLMKTPNLSPELKLQYNIRQLALKLTANSMYGCLGATHCRFYAKGLAALVTSKGREILQNTKTLVEKLNFEVIYGDTDSIMINTKDLDYDKALANAKKIKQEVNKLYKRVELDIDGVFRYLLLLQKKKYAAVLMNKTPSGKIELVMEHKGLDIVRRDWCQLACDTGKTILDQLLSDQENDLRREKIFEMLANVSTSLREARVPLASLVVTKQLSKNPKDYPEKKLPHVSIALRLNKEGGRMWKAGDTVPYIICEDGTTRSATERAYHVDEFKKSDSLKIDVDYYLLSQVFPVVLRICEPIEGIDDVLLAKHLGLEGVYKSKRVIHEQEDVEVPLQINEDRYKYCIPLKFKCRNAKCNQEVEMKEFFTDFPSGRLPSLALCPNAECDTPPWKYAKAIQNEVQLALRNFITEYYANWMECEDPICSNRTRHLPMNIRGNYPRCDLCKDAYMHRIYSETMLYKQICFFLHLFDLSQAGKNLQGATSPEMISAYDSLKEFVERQLRRNAYSLVNLDSIFKAIRSTPATLALVDEAEDSDFEFSDDESEMMPEVKEPAAS